MGGARGNRWGVDESGAWEEAGDEVVEVEAVEVEEADADDYAQSLAYGWPAVHDEPTLPRAPGRALCRAPRAGPRPASPAGRRP